MITHRLWNHILCWVIFITYEIVAARYMGDTSSLLAFGCFYVLSIVLFYFNAHSVLAKFWPNRSPFGYITTTVLILSELVVYSYLSVVLSNLFKGASGIRLLIHIDSRVFASAAWRGVYFILLSSAYYAIISATRATKQAAQTKIRELNLRNKTEKLGKEIIALQNAYLRARINPHFLFNTLNFIYNQATEGNPNTVKNISLLSEIMQYSLASPANDGKVPLSHEIDHIKRYIKLNLSRFGNTLFLQQDISIQSDAENIRIPPLILLTFIENVFKHGDMTDRNFPAIIRISYTNNLLTLYTKNKKSQPRALKQEGSGLKNALMRLESCYSKDDIHFSCSAVHQSYIVNLILKLSCSTVTS